MKKILCILLVAVMLVTACASVCAEKADPLVLLSAEEELADEWSEMLGLKKRPVNLGFDGPIVKTLTADPNPDIFLTSHYFTEAMDAGMAAAFEPTDLMKKDMASMPQCMQDLIRDSLTTEDGKLLGYIESTDLLTMGFYVPDAWAASPFRDMTPPSSLEELLDFLEIYLETPHDGFCFIYDIRNDWNVQYAVYTLLRCWALQCHHAGKPLRFNDPQFIRLLERTKDLSTRLFKAEKGPKHQKGRQLFQDQCMGHTNNNLDTVTFASLIPWRITKDQPPLVMVWANLYCMRSGSPYEDRAAELLEYLIPYRDYEYPGDPERTVYNTLGYIGLHPDKVKVEEINRYDRKNNGKKYDCMLITQEYIDSVWDIHKYAVATLASDNDENPASKHTYEQYIAALKKFLNGKITAAEYAAKLDKMNE